MDAIIGSLKDMSDNEAREYIAMLFEGYEKRKKTGEVFNFVNIPEIIITTYFTCVKKPGFNNIIDTFKNKHLPLNDVNNFKKRYLYNENKLEDVHSQEEYEGLRLVYDYISQKQDLDDISLYDLSDIHRILFSKTPYPEFGGQYRRDERYLPYSGIDITSPSLITHEMIQLNKDVDEIIEEAKNIYNTKDSSKIIGYINKCLDLKCKLIKIHPFGDGNGRSVRAFMNLLFKLVSIPPVYIENKERDKYGEAMQAAMGEGDFSKLRGFYYYKICDSIISLDVALKSGDKSYSDQELTNKNNEKGMHI